jgi:hypothetical protein
MKTGDQCNYDSAKQAGYYCFLRADFLRLLEAGKLAGVGNHIFNDFHDHLRALNVAVQSFETVAIENWKKEQWRGFFMILKEKLGDGDWAKRVPCSNEMNRNLRTVYAAVRQRLKKREKKKGSGQINLCQVPLIVPLLIFKQRSLSRVRSTA